MGGAGRRVVVAGASGRLGRCLVAECAARGYRVRALVRDPSRAARIDGAEEAVAVDLMAPDGRLAEALDGADVVLSAAGQPCALRRLPDRRSFRAVDPRINRALLAAAFEAGVDKFVYVAVLAPASLRGLAYVAAHEEFATDLAGSGIDYAVIRANGIFWSYLEMLELAQRGRVPIFGDGGARSNPIHEADLACVCADAIEGERNEVAAGGLETLTRREEAELCFAALGRRPRLLRIHRPLLTILLPLLSLGDRRRAEMLAFLAALGRTDVLASASGSRRLGDYLREQVDRSDR